MGAVLRVRRLAALGRRRRESGVHRRVRFGNAAAFELRASILGGLGRNLDFRCWAAGDCRWALRRSAPARCFVDQTYVRSVRKDSVPVAVSRTALVVVG